MSGFPLDLLCTPIRFVTQLLWMGLRERQNGKEGGRKGERDEEGEIGSGGERSWLEQIFQSIEKTRMRVGAIEKENGSKGKRVQAWGYERTAGFGLEDF